jgi:toxin ParE1/3/4
MANKDVAFEDAAAEEVEAAFRCYLDRSITAAEDFVNELRRTTDSIAAAPHRWPRSAFGTRRVVLRRFPFVIFYRELSSLIKIVAVAHGNRAPGYWKERS